MTALSHLCVTCPRCREEVTYDRERELWVGDNDDRCRLGGDLPGGHKQSVEGALFYALTMDGLNGLLQKLAGG